MKTMIADSLTDASAAKPEKLKALFEGLYEKYNRRELIKPDPLQFVYRYTNPADMEIVGLLSACLAYGRVEQIQNDLNDLLGKMGSSPHKFVINFTNKDRASLEDFKHRFNTGNDISDLLTLLKSVLAEYGSIEEFFLLGFNTAHENTISALMRFCDSLLDKYRMMWHGLPARPATARRSLVFFRHISAFAETSENTASPQDALRRMAVPRGLAFLLAGPGLGGAAKRLNLFLRWMVRSDDVDAGLWRSVDKSKLIVPVDVHIARLCRILGFHSHKNVSLKTAVEITRNFARISPDDPVKYDFALSRIGILEDCTGRRKNQCNVCELLPWCRNRKDW